MNCYFVITENPSDYPGRFVVRKHMVEPGGCDVALLRPTVVVGTLEEARAAVPPGLVHVARDPFDDPVIVETWI